MASMHEAARYVIPANVVCETLNDEMVLLNLDTGVYFGLNASGVCVWEHLRREQHYESAVSELCERARTPEPQVRRDVERLVVELTQHGLIREADQSGSAPQTR